MMIQKKETEMKVVMVTKAQPFGNEVLATFTKPAEAAAFAANLADPAVNLVECNLVVGPFGMKMVPVV